MLFEIQLDSVASQSFSTILDGQKCKINVFQKDTNVYVDLYCNGATIFTGQIALNLVGLSGAGFSGRLFFYDTQGNNEPDFNSFGTRYKLMYDDNK